MLENGIEIGWYALAGMDCLRVLYFWWHIFDSKVPVPLIRRQDESNALCSHAREQGPCEISCIPDHLTLLASR